MKRIIRGSIMSDPAEAPRADHIDRGMRNLLLAILIMGVSLGVMVILIMIGQ